MNKVILIGNLTRDPELTQTPSGVPICKFGLAVQRNFNNANGEKEVDFFNIVAWRALGENCSKYLLKGRKAAISGSINIRNYEQDGVKKQAVDIVADDVEFLTPKGEQGGDYKESISTPAKKASVKDSQPVDDDELPF